MKSKLTPKQAQFVIHYLVDLNATQAAIRAGYKGNNPRNIGSENLAKPYIAAAIQEAMDKRSERTKIDADWVLNHNAEMLEADIADIIDDNGSYLPIKQWPKIWRQMLAGIDVQELFEGSGSSKKKIGTVKKFKFIDRLRALELLGKHVNIQAYRDRIDMHHGGQADNPLYILAQAVQGAALLPKKQD
jgi:phage terminase small subunit